MSQKSSARIKSKRRSGEPWVSNNRVLNSTSTTKKGTNIGRNPNFDTDETKLLIQLWGDPKVQRTLIIAHKKHAVLCDLASKMQQYGYYRSPEEISTRIKNLKCFYNRLKKEIDLGVASAAEPTWKHYAEMDAIMKRPIFSVRPNEVPPPSLKYQLEKAREEREERRRKALEEGGTVSESDDGLDELVALSNGKSSKNEIDDGIIPDVEVDINDEAFAAIASAAENTVTTLSATKRRKVSKASEGSLELGSEFEDERGSEIRSNGDNDLDDLQIKEENDSMDSDEFPLIKEVNRRSVDGERTKLTLAQKQKSAETKKVAANAASALIKEEPIDVDADDEIEDTTVVTQKSLMPTLMDRLADKSTSIIIPASSPMTIVSTATNVSRVSTTTTSSAQSVPQGKISLVPTNFLMQPKPQPTPTVTTPTTPAPTPTPTSMIPLHQSQIQLLPNALNATGALQSGRILLSSKGGVGGAQSTPTSAGFVATGPGGMKLLLVNADQAAAQIGASNAALGKTLLPQLNAALLQQQQQQKQQKQQQQLQQQQQEQQAQQQQLQKEQQQLQQQQQLKEAEEAKAQAASKRHQKLLHERQRREELFSRKEAANTRVLLRHIYNAQTENNEIQQQRLALERERFEFERTAVERFFTELPKLLTQHQQQQQQQAQVLQQQQQQVAAAMQAHTQQMRLNPPKLVFTTASVGGGAASLAGVTNGATLLTPSKLTANAMPKLAPAPNAVITQAHPAPASTPTPVTVVLPEVVECDGQTTTDVQLVTPKVECEE